MRIGTPRGLNARWLEYLEKFGAAFFSLRGRRIVFFAPGKELRYIWAREHDTLCDLGILLQRKWILLN
jgi:hypothetical protein